jgi:hypothetical protein
MTTEFLLATFLISVGLCVAGAGTHLYQWRSQQQAMLRVDGATVFASLGNLAMSTFCGPYIMLHMGWSQENGNTVSMGSALVSAVVAFGWAFVIGLLVVGGYYFGVQPLIAAI